MIACVTIPHVLPRVPEPPRRKVVSLIDLAIQEVLACPERHLLLTTTGTRTARIFEFGCTELHLIHRLLGRHAGKVLGRRVVDPLLVVARDLKILL